MLSLVLIRLVLSCFLELGLDFVLEIGSVAAGVAGAAGGSTPPSALAAARTVLDEIDDHRDPVEPEAFAQSVFKVVGVRLRDP